MHCLMHCLMHCSMHCSTPARRGSRSRPPLRRPRPLRFERLRVPVWDPYSRGRPGPAKSEDQKGGEGKADANLTDFFLAPAAPGTPTRRHALGRLPTPPPLPENLLSDCTESCPLRPLGAPRRFRNPKIGQQLGHSPLRGLGGGLGDASPARRGSRSRTASPPASPPTSPPAPLAIRKAPSASVESIEPRPPRPCEVGRPKGRRRKNRRQSHKFFFSTCCALAPQLAATPWGASPPPPLGQKLRSSLHTKRPPL